jgi:ribonuclease HII
LHSLNPRDSLIKRFPVCRWAVGVDEVGAGCLAGPLVAAAALYDLSSDWVVSGEAPSCRITDSKKLSDKQKLQASEWLFSKSSFRHVIKEISPERIDEINIYWARMEALGLAALELIANIPQDESILIYIDGPVLPPLLKNLSPNIQTHAESKGDLKYFPVAAASILAKNFRDNLMGDLAKEFPVYGWESNVGYPSPSHKKALREHGMTPWHRKSFSCL